MKYLLKNLSIWELGKRSNQEDSIYPEHDKLKDTDKFFIVCDGMGGHSAGEVASATVCQSLAKSIKDNVESDGCFGKEQFDRLLSDVYRALDKVDDGAEKKMGTTLTFLMLHSDGAFIAHIGDSRVYHIRPGKDASGTEILFQTKDHSLINDLIRIGELTPEEAKISGYKNVISRAMQPNMARRAKADIYSTRQIEPGDYFLLCTDGILENIEDDNIKYIFSDDAGDIMRKREILIKSTEQNKDNHSAIIVHVLDVLP